MRIQDFKEPEIVSLSSDYKADATARANRIENSLYVCGKESLVDDLRASLKSAYAAGYQKAKEEASGLEYAVR